MPLGTASTFGVLAASTVTNIGFSVVTGDLGVSPGTAITGFPPGVVTAGTIASAAAAAQAQTDLSAAYNNAALRTPTAAIAADMGGLVLTPGVYRAAGTLALTGRVELNGQNDPNSVFIFQIPTTFTTAANSAVSLTGGTRACNVFYQIGTSATFGGGSSLSGTLLSNVSISFASGVVINGGVLARTGAVTLVTTIQQRPGL